MKARMFWVQGPWPGRLAVMPRPRGGDWLDDEMKSWRDEGVDAVVSLLVPDEVQEFRLEDEPSACRNVGMQFFSLPIDDRSVPGANQSVLELLSALGSALTAGRSVVIHCRQGIGRAGLVAAALLIQSGTSASAAITRVSNARGCVIPETNEQIAWIANFEKHLEAIAASA